MYAMVSLRTPRKNYEIFRNYARTLYIRGMKELDEVKSIVNEPAARYQKAHEGITKSDFIAVVAMTGLNLSEFSAFLPVSKRTIEKVKEEELLNPLVSDRVLQIATLYQQGIELFGSTAAFKEWMNSSVISLGGKKPINFIDNATGIAIVHDLLGRIEHGVYS